MLNDEVEENDATVEVEDVEGDVPGGEHSSTMVGCGQQVENGGSWMKV